MSIKNVPEKLAQRLRDRADRHNRSLQGELLTILQESVEDNTLSLEEADELLRENELRTDDTSQQIIRDLRDAS
jgi:plasmid stability protein